MNCPQCGTENPESARFCLQCGEALRRACAECRVPLPAGANFCLQCGARLRPAGAQQWDSSPVIPDALQRLVPREYAERLLATRGQVPRERRIVTLLFCDVAGSTALAENIDPEDWLEIMDAAFDILIQPIARHEGTLARLMGDAVLAFFGAPLAHEDDPERACRAALEIIAGVKAYAARLEQERGIPGFAVRAGIHTGPVVVGEVGSDLRVEYTAMGDAVNLASRLEQAAPEGGILISHDTYRHVRGVFDVQPQPPLAVPGKAQLLHTYLLQRAKPRAFRKSVRRVEGIETRMVGREAELKHLQDAFRTVLEDGELQVVTVCGEAGVGKSRLLHEFDIWSEALPQPFYYFKGRASREIQHLPYAVIRDLLAFRFQIRDDDAPAQVQTKLEEGMGAALDAGPETQRAAHLIGYLLGFEWGAGLPLSGLDEDTQARRDQALAQLACYFQAMAGRHPLLILLEDLHWADDSSLDALNRLATALAAGPVLIASAARPLLFERRPHWGEGQPFHTRLDLPPLSKWDSRRLVAEILQKVDAVPDAFRDRIVAGAEGNPFFIEELIKMLVDEGIIVKSEDHWQVATLHLDGVHVPPTLNGLLQARLDRLPPQDKTVLQQASVVGRLFWDQALVHINQARGEQRHGIDPLSSLPALREREMIFQRETSAFAGAQEYLFKHALLREVAYQSVLKRQRRTYHSRVADWLLEQAGERAGEYTGLLADHLERAGRTAEAVEHLLQAGDRARGLYAHREAIAAYERALALLQAQGEDRRAAQTLMKLGLTYDAAFDFRQARQAYEAGFAQWQRAAKAQPVAPPPPAPHALRLVWKEPPTLDPTRLGDHDLSSLVAQLFRTLLEHTVDMGILPDAAQSWQVLDGGRRYVFHLRQDISWSDGRPVTAGDFEYTWLRWLAPCGMPEPCYCTGRLLFDVQGARAFHRNAGRREDVGVRAVDDFTLVVDLEAPTGHFLHLVADRCPAIPRHVVEIHGEAWTDVDKIVTNGPFRLASWQPGESLVLVRDPGYRGHATGNVQRVELTFLPAGEPLAALELYAHDGLDVLSIRGLPPSVGARWSSEYITVPFLGTSWVGFDVQRPPFDDARVRQAFVLATDRERLTGAVLQHFPASGGFVPLGMPGHSPGIALPYDPEKARTLLAEAGYPAGRCFPAIEARSFGMPALCQYLQEQWRANLGVEVPWEIVDAGPLDQRFYANPPHMSRSGWAADCPDPDNFLRLAFPWQMTGWRNKLCERMIEEARRLTDQPQRMALYRQADRMIVEEAVVLPLTYRRRHMLLKPWVKRYPTSALTLFFWKDVILEPH